MCKCNVLLYSIINKFIMFIGIVVSITGQPGLTGPCQGMVQYCSRPYPCGLEREGLLGILLDYHCNVCVMVRLYELG
jgi:hypothetical protein